LIKQVVGMVVFIMVFYGYDFRLTLNACFSGHYQTKWPVSSCICLLLGTFQKKLKFYPVLVQH